MAADLHCHTKISDGSTGIDEIVELAKNRGLSAIAITDHDTFAGVTRAQVHGRKLGVQVIHGAEVSAMDMKRGRLVHILCYNCTHPDRMEGAFKKIGDSRKKAMNIALYKVMRLYPITPQMVAKRSVGSATVFKSHIMQALMDAGYTDKVYGGLYKTLFDWKRGLARTKISYPDVYDMLDLIHEAGGLAVMAHPGVYDSHELLKELVNDKKLDGIECSYPRAKDGETEMLTALADKYKLIKTGGTDFHGCNCTTVHPLGTCTTDDDQLALITKKR